jgi:multiple sugar transport system permease protein
MFPLTLIVVGIYVLFNQLNLLDTYLGLILAFTSFSLPFAIWMMEGFFNTIPRDLEEAAMVDGSGRFGTLFKVILPLTRPGIIAVGVYSFLNSWNNLLFALSLTSSQDMRTIAPGFLLTYVGEFQYFWADAMAGSVIVTLPMIVIFIMLQRHLVQGMTAGAVKE